MEKNLLEYLVETCDILDKFRTLTKIEEKTETLEEILNEMLPLPRFTLIHE